MHIELVSASATQPNTGAAATALTGDSLTVKNGILSAGVDIIALWSTQQTAGFNQILFPSAHDTTRGYRASAPVGVNPFALPLGVKMPVQPQELMSLTIAGSNSAGDVEQMSMLIRYGNLPGVSQRLMTDAQVLSQMKKLTTIEQSITSSAGPGYSGSVAINNASDLLRANTDYAVMGISCRTAVNVVTLVGPDTGNVKIGVPCTLRQELQSGFFMMLSRATGDACVPVINSGNKSSTFMGVATDENAGTFVATLFLAELN
jgi:hypothetical protein